MHTANGFTKRRTGKKPDDMPLHSLDDERALLASVLVDAARLPGVLQIVEQADFFGPSERALFALIVDVYREHGTADTTIVGNRWKGSSFGEITGGVSFITDLFNEIPTSTNAEYFARRIRELSLRRRGEDIAYRMRTRVRDGESLLHVAADTHHEAELLLAALEGVDCKPRRFRAITAAELAQSQYQVDYVVEGILAANQPCGLLGPQKALKTSIALDLAVAIATGGCFLGRFRCHNPRRVLVMTGESGLATVQETTSRICDAAFANLADIENLSFCDTLPRFGNSTDLAELRRMLKDGGYGVLMVDPLYLCIDVGGNEGSIYAMGAALRGISELCQTLGVTLVLLHHLRKSVANPYEPGELSDASWAGVGEYCRQWLIINRRERYKSGSGLHRLWMSVGGSAGHSGLWGVDVDEGVGHGNRHWAITVQTADEVRAGEDGREDDERVEKAAGKLEADVRRLCDTLVKHPDGETKSKLRDFTGLNGTRMNAAVADALGRGAIEPCEVPRNGRTESGFKLTAGGGDL